MVDETKQPQGGAVGGDDKGVTDRAGGQTPPTLDVQLPSDVPSNDEADAAQVVFNNQDLNFKTVKGEVKDQEGVRETVAKLEKKEEDKDESAGMVPMGQVRDKERVKKQEEDQTQSVNQGLISDYGVVSGEETKEETKDQVDKMDQKEEQKESEVKSLKTEGVQKDDLAKQVEELVALVDKQNQALNQGGKEDQKEVKEVEKEEIKTEATEEKEEGLSGKVREETNLPTAQAVKSTASDQTSDPITPNPDDFQKDKFGSVTYDFTDEDGGDEAGFWGKGLVEEANKDTTQPPTSETMNESGKLQEEKPMTDVQSETKTIKKGGVEGLKEESEKTEMQSRPVEREGGLDEQINQGVDLPTQEGVGGEEKGKMNEVKDKDLQDKSKEVGAQVSEEGQEKMVSSGTETADLKKVEEENKEPAGEGGVSPTPPTPPEGLKSAAEEPPKKRFHWMRWVSVGLSVLIVVGIGLFAWQKLKKDSGQDLKPKLTEVKPEPKKSDVKLVYWGLWEEGRVMKPLLDKFKKETGITVEYVQKSPRDYRLVLESAIKEGKGPDVFRFHNTWVPMLKEELDDVPADVYSAEEFAQTFYPVAVRDLSWQGRLKGVPLEIDGLVLFYNKDLLAKAGLDKDLPTNWDQLAKQARQLTTYGEGGKINVAGVALGTVNNVDHWSDVVGLMFYQNGVEMEKLDTSLDAQGRNLAADVLRYYTHFVTGSKPTWSEDLPPSTVMFGSGRLAFYFGPSWRAFEFARNGVNFGIINVPKIPGDNSEWASYWVEGVSVKSKYKKEAWELVKFLSQAQNLRLFFNEAKKYRLFGEPYARQDMREELAKDPYLSVLAAAAPNMKSYYFASFTHDQGLNDRINDALGFGITQVLSGEEPEGAIREVKRKIDQILASYGAIK